MIQTYFQSIENVRLNLWRPFSERKIVQIGHLCFEVNFSNTPLLGSGGLKLRKW